MELEKLPLKLGVEGGVKRGRGCLERSRSGECPGQTRPVSPQGLASHLLSLGSGPALAEVLADIPASRRPWHTGCPFWLMIRFAVLPKAKETCASQQLPQL